MNEQIKKMMVEAGMLYTMDPKPVHIDCDGTHTFTERNIYDNFDPAKFAELIVRECGHLMVDMMLLGGVDPEQGYDIMMKHFGVK